MAITYTEDKNFTPQQVADLFLAVRWVVGKYPDRLHKALMNSSRVISAWDGDRLVGLIRVMDDGNVVGEGIVKEIFQHKPYGSK